MYAARQSRHAQSLGACLLLGRQARAEEEAGHVARHAVCREPHDAQVALREQEQRERVLRAHAGPRILALGRCVCSGFLFLRGAGLQRAERQDAGRDARGMQQQRERVLRGHASVNEQPASHTVSAFSFYMDVGNAGRGKSMFSKKCCSL